MITKMMNDDDDDDDDDDITPLLNNCNMYADSK